MKSSLTVPTADGKIRIEVMKESHYELVVSENALKLFGIPGHFQNVLKAMS